MNGPVVWKGLVAGCAGGLAASWAMGLAHGMLLKLAPGSKSQQSQSEDSTVKAARAMAQPILDRELTPTEADAGGLIVHYAFGTSVVAAYGVTAEFAPRVSCGAGVPFGAAVWLGAHVIAVPALGFSPPVTQSPAASEVAEFLAHLLYGGVAGIIRSRVRRSLRG